MAYQASPHLIRVFDYEILHMELNTVLYILVLALVVMFLMNRLLFRPVLRTLENRESLMETLQGNTAQRREEVQRLTEQYREDLARVREQVARVRAESHRETQQAVNEILAQARSEAQAEFDRAMQDLQGQFDQARARVSDTAHTLAEQATRRVLSA